MVTLLNYRLKVTLYVAPPLSWAILMDRNDGRALVGQMLAYDKHMNFVLAECEEFRTVKVRPERSEGAMKQFEEGH